MKNHIDDGDLVYHQKIANQARVMEQAQQQIVQLQQQITAINGAIQSWSEYLQSKYNIGPGVTIDEKGVISREQALSEKNKEARKRNTPQAYTPKADDKPTPK